MDPHNNPELNTKGTTQQATKATSPSDITLPTINSPPFPKTPSSNHSQPQDTILPDSQWSLSDLPVIWRSESQQSPLDDITSPSLQPSEMLTSPWDWMDIPSLPEHPTSTLEDFDALTPWDQKRLLEPLTPYFNPVAAFMDETNKEIEADLAGDFLHSMADYLPPTENNVHKILRNAKKVDLLDDESTLVIRLDETGEKSVQSIPEPTPRTPEGEQQQTGSPPAARRTIFPVPNLGDLHVGISPIQVDDYKDYPFTEGVGAEEKEREARAKDEEREERGITLEEVNEAGIRAVFPPLDYDEEREERGITLEEVNEAGIRAGLPPLDYEWAR